MIRKAFIIGLFIAGTASMYACSNNPQRDQKGDYINPIDPTPLPPDSIDHDTTRIESLPPGIHPRIYP